MATARASLYRPKINAITLVGVIVGFGVGTYGIYLLITYPFTPPFPLRLLFLADAIIDAERGFKNFPQIAGRSYVCHSCISDVCDAEAR